MKYHDFNTVQAIAFIKNQRRYVSIAHSKSHIRALQKYAEHLGFPKADKGSILGTAKDIKRGKETKIQGSN